MARKALANTFAAIMVTMSGYRFLAAAAFLAALATPAAAKSPLQCVPYARDVSGIRIFGDAHTWWNQAAGRYERGSRPRVGAVMAMRPHGNSTLGHVAAVSRVLDSRTVLVRHANWSAPGLIENDVKVVDVSDDNSWSAVRVWYGPGQRLGARNWPLFGFIYGSRSGRGTALGGSAANGNDPIGQIISGAYRAR